jgi:hypothetical protein
LRIGLEWLVEKKVLAGGYISCFDIESQVSGLSFAGASHGNRCNALRGFDSGYNPGRFGCYYGKNAGNCNPKGADSRNCKIPEKEFS